jgi:hypothetical protein
MTPDETRSLLARSLGVSYNKLFNPVTATPDKQTGAGGDYSQAVKSGNPNTELKTRTVSTYAVDKYGNLTPRTSTDPVAAAKEKAAQAGAEADALQRQFQTRKTASDLAIFRKADSQSMACIKPSSSMSNVRPMGPQGRGSARPVDTRQTAAQSTVGSSFDALSANDRGSNMTSSAASIEAQRLASRLAAKELAAQKKTISDVPANSYQPETPAAQLSRIDNLDSELAKRSTERRNRMDTQDSLKNYLNR